MFRPELPHVYGAFSTKAEVSNHSLMVGLLSSPEAIRSGRCEPEPVLASSRSELIVNGMPDCRVTMPETSQPLTTRWRIGFVGVRLLPLPRGRSEMYPTLKRLRTSKLETARSSRKSYSSSYPMP